MPEICLMNAAHQSFIAGLPKAELHLHIEGTLTPTQKLRIARRNGIVLPYETEEAISEAQCFQAPDAPSYLQKFLDFYFEGLDVLRTEADFRDIAYEHLANCRRDAVRYVEMSFDPQAHMRRGVSMAAVVEGLHAGIEEGLRDFGVSAQLIMCINRDQPADSAWQMLDAAKPYWHWIVGLGLDSVEAGNPPLKFQRAFSRAHSDGLRLTAHCDVDQVDSVDHIWQCINVLDVDRIDHGLNCLEDRRLVDALRARRTCLTACPTWRPFDTAPRRVDRIRAMYDQGLLVTLNTDDPGLFASGTLGTMLPPVAAEGNFTKDDLAQLMRNSFEGSFLGPALRAAFVAEIDLYVVESHARPPDEVARSPR